MGGEVSKVTTLVGEGQRSQHGWGSVKGNNMGGEESN